MHYYDAFVVLYGYGKLRNLAVLLGFSTLA